ncbi:glycosyltransferase [Georgenia sp. 10Sc9-8]|uniref:Glycosyltransferase n=1 Tax=Georgenia halotolerans TaxID=3028317 RepID=A0ABT5TZW7_9MICO|nr:glycosyltransferase [Georgenia halotolerans]
MHAVLTAVGSHGDVLPVVGLGRALAARGHRVTVMTNPYFRQLVEGAGLELAPIGTAEQYTAATTDPELWHPQRALRVVVRRAVLPGMRPAYDYLAGLDPARTVVAASALALGARLAQERLGMRLATVHLQPSLFLSAHDNAELGGLPSPDWLPTAVQELRLRAVERVFLDPLLAPGLNAFRGELGLPPVRSVLRRWIHSPQRVIGLFPEWFAPPQPDWPPQTVLTGFLDERAGATALDPALQAFLDDGAPPLVVTAGSAMRQGAALFRAAVHAARRLGRRAVLLTGYPEQLPDPLPAGMHHVTWAPLPQLLPRAAALVHHGGIGTSAQGLRAGVPQLVVPFSHDQPDNANRLRALGVADRFDPHRLTEDRLAVSLDRLLRDAETRRRCARCAARVDMEAAADQTCRLIEAL